MSKRINDFFIALFFLLAISSPLIFSDKVGGKKSETENRYLATFPKILTEDLKLTPGLKDGLEKWIKDNAGFRTEFQKIYSDSVYQIFNESSNEQVHVGKEGWLFYKEGYNLEIATGNYPLSDYALEKIKTNQEYIQETLNNVGIEYVLVLVPSKVSIYPEYIQGNFSVQDTIIDIVTDYLKENTTITVINTKEDLLKMKESKQVYFKTDTHWNESGAYVGYSAVINELKEQGMIQSNPARITTYPSHHRGDLVNMLGVSTDLIPEEFFEETAIISQNAISVQEGTYYDQMQELMALGNIKPEFYFLFQNKHVEEKRALIYGDSFFTYWEVPSLFAENFSHLDYIRSDLIDAMVIKNANPDIVILQRSERYIYTLTKTPDLSLLEEQ